RRTPPVSGNNLALTLDAKLQEMAEKAFGDRKGSLVAIEPATGGVLALVSSPTFDPNLFVDGITPENWKDLNDDPKKPMVNRAINGAYPPGSTFKPFMALAALEAGKRTPAQVINDPGFFTFGNHTFRDDKKGGHGAVDMYKSIVHSCDTYYYMLANDLGIDGIARFMGSIGLGQRTGVDLGKDDSGESKGVLPSPEWKRQRFKRPEQQKWYAGETISIGIGQGYNAYTPIQLAQATATVANNGVMFRPHLVSHITDARTGARRPIEPQPIRTLDWKPQNIETIKRALVGVNKEGTGARAFAGASYEAAGKTGTAQVFSLKGAQYREGGVKKELRDHALFIAFAPVENPRIALAILVENGGFGAQSAAPIARMVFDYYLLGKVPAGAAGEDAAAVENDNDEE
ncbi:MAG TPA: penicillin-binding protein 2, partial [Rhodocyclaceae bacterium]|nr:penicillin-binding protein 2 [Rhodocyclaceae bacterium]